MAAGACCALQMGGAPVAAGKFKRLSVAEIRAGILGKVVAGESHWSDHFRAGGPLGAIELGKTVPANWSLCGDELCMTRRCKTGLKTERSEVVNARPFTCGASCHAPLRLGPNRAVRHGCPV